MSGYTVASNIAIARKRTTFEWVNVDISTVRAMDLFALYRNVEIAISDIFGGEHTLDIYDYEFTLRNVSLTISEWLGTLGDNALTLLKDGFPSLSTANAYYTPGMRYEGDYSITRPNTHPSHDVPLEDCTDLMVRYKDMDMANIAKSGLVSVNGYYYQSNYDSGYIRVPHAGSNIMKCELTSFGFLNFDNIGTIDTYGITKDMVVKVDDSLDYFNRIHIKTRSGLTNKTVGIVIGGYLHLLDDVLKVTSDNTIALTLGKIDIVHRVIESQNTLDLEFMKLGEITEGVSVKEIMNPELLLEYITCKHSFIVVISNPDMFKSVDPTDNVNINGVCTCDESITPSRLVDKYGRAIDYWYTVESGIRCMQFDTKVLDNYLYQRTHWMRNLVINDARVGRGITTRVSPYLHKYSARVKK